MQESTGRESHAWFTRGEASTQRLAPETQGLQKLAGSSAAESSARDHTDVLLANQGQGGASQQKLLARCTSEVL